MGLGFTLFRADDADLAEDLAVLDDEDLETADFVVDFVEDLMDDVAEDPQWPAF